MLIRGRPMRVGVDCSVKHPEVSSKSLRRDYLLYINIFRNPVKKPITSLDRKRHAN